MTKQTKDMKLTEYFNLCNDCGKELYPNANFEPLGAITVSSGTCPRCNKKDKTLTPVRDYEIASGKELEWD